MKKISFLLCIHNHQPVGNFEHIFHKAFTCAYKPFIECLCRHPQIKATLHFSGTLLEWITAEQPAFLETLQKLTLRGQIEMLGGGFYEPIFSMVPERDAIGQLQLMNRFLEEHFSRQPWGAWIPERVWDPILPRLLAEAGIEYTLLDSTHFITAGLPPQEIRGYYVTEREGKTLSVFPIDVNLRYSIPFHPPEKTIQYLKFIAAEDEHCAVTYGDDGEKFGLWPGTYLWVYEQGWLERFFSLLEQNADMICLQTLSEYFKTHPPQGTIYLPTLAYEEMMEWALPADAVARFETLKEKLSDLGLQEKYRAFIQGSYWNNFLTKYPESNQMHKKMLLVSQRLEMLERSGVLPEKARRELYKGQCNCAYWHGLFGGVYLNYLRHAVYTHLITAEILMDKALHGESDWSEYRLVDFNKDLSEDILVFGKNLNLYCSPKKGGSVFELDFKPCAFNITNTFTRKLEAYHRHLKLDTAPPPEPSAPEMAPLSLQGMFRAKQEGLHNHLVYDWYQRYMFLDHFLDPATTLESFARCCYTEHGDFITAPYALEHIEKETNAPAVSFTLVRDGQVVQGYHQHPLRIAKTFSVHDAHGDITVLYRLRSGADQILAVWFGIEINISMLVADDTHRYFLFPQRELGKQPMVATVSADSLSVLDIKDDWNGLAMRIEIQPPGSVWTFPVQTVSRSEDGLELTYQGSTIMLHWKLELPPGRDVHRTVRVCVYQCRNEHHVPTSL